MPLEAAQTHTTGAPPNHGPYNRLIVADRERMCDARVELPLAFQQRVTERRRDKMQNTGVAVTNEPHERTIGVAIVP